MAEPTFDRARFSAALHTRRLGRHLVARAEVESTNDVAWDALAQGAPDGTAVVADIQTRGRGRAGRTWISAPGRGLALSLVLHAGCERPSRPDPKTGGWGTLPLAAGLALARALERFKITADLKWPNDLLLGGRKLAGILCESRRVPLAGADVPAEVAVVGVGVNVGEREEDFPPELRERATSLAIAGASVAREDVAAAFLDAFEPLWIAHEEGGREQVLAAWRARAGFFGQPVRVRTARGELSGVARTVDDDGALVLTLESGVPVSVLAGDLEVGDPR